MRPVVVKPNAELLPPIMCIDTGATLVMTRRSLESTQENGRSAEGDDRRARIVETAARLFAEHGYHNVPIRDIAEEAGVTHPLIYYYWSSKDELLAAAVERSQSRVRLVSGADTDALDTILAMMRETIDHNRQYIQTLTRALLDGMSPSEWPGGYPGVEAALALLTAGADPGGDQDIDARERFACALAAMLGWSLVEDQLLEIVGLGLEHRERGRKALLAVIRDVLEPAALEA